MKKKFVSLYLVFITSIVSAQTECMDLTNYTDQYLDFVSTDDIVFPIGSAFITTGGLNYIKIDDNDVYQTISGDTLTFSGNIGINAQFFDCSNYQLEMGISNPVGMAVDGTVVFSGGNPPTSFTGSSFTFTSTGSNSYKLEGMFTNVVLSSPSTQLYEVCFTCEGMGIEEHSAGSFLIYPNPSTEKFTVDFPSETAQITLSDFSGRVINDQLVTAQSTIEITDLPAGSYHVTCTMPTGNSLHTVLIKK
jgi:hypothetical protein